MVLTEQIIYEEIERLLNEKKWKRKKNASVPDPNTYKRKVSSKTALSKRVEDAKREAERKREAAAKRAKNRNATNKSGNIARPKRPSSSASNNGQNPPQLPQTNQSQTQQQLHQQQTQGKNNLPPKPTQDGGDMCRSRDFIGTCINKIKKKISDLYVGWPKSLFSMTEDSKRKEGTKDVDRNNGKNDIDKILSDFEDEFKRTTTIANIRKMFAKLFELWTITNTDRAQDYNDKCSALKKNLKNYRKIFTTYRSKFTNNFKTLDINKSHLKFEYNIIQEDIAYWEERISEYSPKIQEILKDHISMLEDNRSTYKSRMFWYFKAPKFMRKKTKATKASSDAKWRRRKAAFKRFRQKGRQAIKNYVNKGPSAASSGSSS